MSFSKYSLFSERTALKEEQALLQEVDFEIFAKKSIALVKKYHPEASLRQWQLFCEHLRQFDGEKSEKFMLLQTAFQCLKQPIEAGELAQLMTLASHLKSLDGVRLFQRLFCADVPASERQIKNYLTALQLLVDLYEQPQIFDCVKKSLPKLSQLIDTLQEKQVAYLAETYPVNDIDEIITRFKTQDDLVQFPLPEEEWYEIKLGYMRIKKYLSELKTVPDLRCEYEMHDKKIGFSHYESIAVIIEAVRRTYKMMPYDTQILSLLALVNSPNTGGGIKNRIAQIKTGEGKSIIIAMLAALMALDGSFVDIVTSSSYLAMRDCVKYAPFFAALGLSVSHISYNNPKQQHFHGQILYGTNTDFEFAMLRDGLYHSELRYSMLDDELQPRGFGVVIVDEVDNLFLDTALNSARMAIPGHEDLGWIYKPILAFIKDSPTGSTSELREYLFAVTPRELHDTIQTITNGRLNKWLKSARRARYEKKENYHYVVKDGEIVIVDYANTGRLHEGCQWSHGLHQFLQAKHELNVTPESLTAASVCHSTYFNLYSFIFGLTGTMGDAVEREEIKKIYGVDSFDVPMYFPSKHQKLPSAIVDNKKQQFAKITDNISTMQLAKRPILILFRTVDESKQFSEYLLAKNMAHQLINAIQREDEDYLIAHAGFPGTITVATNTAGRGTDILLSPESKKAGGLHMIFAFYPDNLRVEAQGAGRAGRQGQPGSCCMILSSQDEYLQQLLKKYNLPPIYHFFENIKLFDDLRSIAIKEESEHRYQCSRKESIYFSKLQFFFDDLRELHQLFKNEDFKKKFLAECQLEHDRSNGRGRWGRTSQGDRGRRCRCGGCGCRRIRPAWSRGRARTGSPSRCG